MVPALCAMHVVARLILLDAYSALGAGLGTRTQPQLRCVVRLLLLMLPLVDKVARRRLVLHPSARETKPETAVTTDGLGAPAFVLHNIGASRLWAPTQHLVTLHKIFQEPPVIALEQRLVLDESFVSRMWYHQGASPAELVRFLCVSEHARAA